MDRSPDVAYASLLRYELPRTVVITRLRCDAALDDLAPPRTTAAVARAQGNRGETDIAYSGPYDVDELTRTVAHQVQVSVIPSWLGTTQIRRGQFREPGTLVLSSSEPRPCDGVMTTTTISWSRQPPRWGMTSRTRPHRS